MKRQLSFYTSTFAVTVTLLTLLVGCSKPNSPDRPTSTLPVLSSRNASTLTQTTAQSGGIITSDGGTSVTARGVCWSTAQNPTTTNTKTIDGTGTGSFTSSLTGLTAITTYYVRAYAVNNAGTAYGNEVSFTTSPAPLNIYAGGYEYNSANITVAKYWKNGTAFSLTDGTKTAAVNSMFVSGNDVYAGGFEYNSK